MGASARTVFGVSSLAVAVAIAIAGLAACGDRNPVEDVYPTEGGSPEPPRRRKDAAPEVVKDASVDAPVCGPLTDPVDVLGVLEDPNNDPVGGVITDGVWKLTSAVDAIGDDDAGVTFKRAAILSFSGNTVTWRFDTDEAGKPEDTCCAGSYSFFQSNLIMNVICNGKSETFGYLYDVLDGEDDGGAPRLQIHVGTLHDVYTKQ